MNTLPKNIETDLDGNFMFNKFGLVNISALRSRTRTTLKTKELKRLIKERFAKDITGKIEFIGK